MIASANGNTNRARLEAMRSELVNRRGEKPEIERHPDNLDQAIADENTCQIAMARTREAALLRLIDAALDSVDDGTYGICLDCEGPIHPKRLEALPHALRCVLCAGIEEARDQQ